jgi:hypothetical protein
LFSSGGEICVVSAWAQHHTYFVFLLGTFWMDLKTVFRLVLRTKTHSVIIYFLDIIYIESSIHVPGPGAILLAHKDGNFSFELMVWLLMFYLSLRRLYWPGPGLVVWLKMDIDLQSSRPYPIVTPFVGLFVNSELMQYLSGDGELFLLSKS